MAGDKAMFGSGTYMAESSTKADQYTGKIKYRNISYLRSHLLAMFISFKL
jgi:hypothetical protein